MQEKRNNGAKQNHKALWLNFHSASFFSVSILTMTGLHTVRLWIFCYRTITIFGVWNHILSVNDIGRGQDESWGHHWYLSRWYYLSRLGREKNAALTNRKWTIRQVYKSSRSSYGWYISIQWCCWWAYPLTLMGYQPEQENNCKNMVLFWMVLVVEHTFLINIVV